MFCAAKTNHSEAVKAVMVVAYQNRKLAYVSAKINSTIPVMTLVHNAGLCLLKTDGSSAIENTNEPIAIIISCQ
ncbi:MAG TPA: hypothetical protein VMQ52_04025 [Candidatus Saccharimonadales bacterium]|nr:hypothetical protein [Candidatus Saccharimonadales bacterium]